MALRHRLQASQTYAEGQVPGNPMVRRYPQFRFTPTSVQPPPGSYDPSLDAALGRTNRGYGDLLSDYAPADGSQGAPGRLTQRAQDDLRLGIDRITGTAGSYTRGLADLLRDRARAQQDFQTARTDANNSAGRQIEDTSRSFKAMGARQGDMLNATGQADTGAAIAAAQIRGTNEAFADNRIHENLARALAGINTRADRFTADSGTQETRLGENRDQAVGQLGLNYQRFSDDAATKLARAGREKGFFGQDTQAQKIAQAKAGGWTAPRRPGNEHVGPHGVYRTVQVRGRAVNIRPDGTVV